MEDLIKLEGDILHHLDFLPRKPGIYKFLDSQKYPIYIGKAKNLKNRVKSYFSRKNSKSKKEISLLLDASYLAITLTNTELEALLLEQHFIKKWKPKFNIQFKDDKGYPWIKIDKKKDFPSAVTFLGKKKEGEKFYGPFPSSFAVKETLTLIQKIFKIRNCSETYFKNRTRPCLQHQIGRCSAPCVGFIKKNEYLKEVKDVEKLLHGEGDHLIQEFYKLMDKYSDKKQYERAANYRDKLSSLREIQRNQSISGFGKDRDAVSISTFKEVTRIGVTSVRGAWIVSHENFIYNNNSIDLEILEAFIIDYYFSKNSCPPTILISDPLEDRINIQKALSEHFCKRITITERANKKDKGLIEISKSNTKLSLNKEVKKKKSYRRQFSLLKNQLGLKEDIRLIESYDISHHSGKNTVGVCIVYNKRGKVKGKYRIYNIHKDNSSNDIASLKEVIKRRYKNKKIEKPDLILIDGGFTHLKAVKETLLEGNIQNIELLSISKGVRRKKTMDSLHLSDGSRIKVNPLALGHLFLQEVRDETHRFAISNLRKKRSKSFAQSNLDGFNGIGKEKKRSLLRYFGSIKQISRAGKEDLVCVPGIGTKNAETIYKNFH